MMLLVDRAFVLFPLLLPIWGQRPLTRLDLHPAPYPRVVAAETILLQKEGIQSADQDLRAQLARELRQTEQKQAFDVLVARLRDERDPKIIATILQQLSAMPFRSPEIGESLPRLLRHAMSDVRYWAVRLAGEDGTTPVAELARLAFEDDAALVRERAADVVCRRRPPADADILARLRRDNSPHIRAAAVAAACAEAASVDWADLPGACGDASVVVRNALAVHLHTTPSALASDLAARLEEDRHPSVRAELAASIGRRQDPALLPVLLRLTTDPDPEVRRSAAGQLVVFPGEECVTALTVLIGDPRQFVRTQAEESAVAVNGASPVAATVAARLSESVPFVRFRAYRVLGRVDAREFAARIAAQLGEETVPRNVAAAVFALGRFEARSAAAPVARLAQHEDAGVREEVARALERFRVPDTYAELSRLAFDENKDVRQAAIFAIGQIGDGDVFNSTVLQILREVDLGSVIKSEDRAAACWCAGRLRPMSRAVLDRVVVQATVPVVPVPMGGFVFEQDTVLVSATFALTQCARDNPQVRPRAERVIRIHGRRALELDLAALKIRAEERDAKLAEAAAEGLPPPIPLPTMRPSPEVIEYARQARAQLDGKTLTRLPRPTRPFYFSYGRAGEKP